MRQNINLVGGLLINVVASLKGQDFLPADQARRESTNFLSALLSTVAATRGDTLTGAARNGGDPLGSRLRQRSDNASYHDIVR